MKMISSLVLVVSAVLVGQSMAASVPEDGSLIKHPAPEEKLDGNQLIKQLSVKDMIKAYRGRVAAYVAEQLYAAKDKATTEVFEELTVQSLIDLNQVELTSCSSKALNSRYVRFNEIYELDHEKRSPDLLFGIIVYVITANLKTFEYCAKNREEIVRQGIATKAELKQLFNTMALPNNMRGAGTFGELPNFTPQMLERAGLVHVKELQSPFFVSLIKHPVSRNKLDKEQLIEKLSQPRLQSEVAEYVAEQLYTAKDKATTEVLEGVSVKSLIEMNTVGLASCSKASMDKMDAKLNALSKINSEGKRFELVYGIFVFALQTEVLVSEYCLKHRYMVVKNKYADETQIEAFAKRSENGKRMLRMMLQTLNTLANRIK